MDQGIRLIADYLRKEFSSQKVFYHRSGRFAILCENGEDCSEINRKLQERFRKPWRADDAELFLEIGSALLDTGNNKYDHNTMIQLLATAFVEAEKADKNEAVIIDSSYGDKACQETEIKKSIEYAIDHDCVEVFLQPIVDANTGKMVGAEAQSIIRDSSGQLIPPGLFIPIAEHNGRIDRLGEQVFIKTCKFFRDYDVQSMGLTFINVNLSPIQFMRQDVGDRMITEAKRYGVPPEFIHLEITEEALIDEHLLVEQTNYIRGRGFNFVLDDYGKGYSNMTRLKSIPFINVKLDMSTVWDYCSNPDDVLPNMVKTFRGVGFSITAEGIEDEVMAEKMRNIGVTYLQGYHFSKPLSISDFVKKYST
jgi:EAL domain-containing protein (putative c-di-GMP-specific phosphodiesterase class I)